MGSKRSFSTCVLLLRAAGFTGVPASCRVGALHFRHPANAKCLLSEQVIERRARMVLRRKAGIAQSFVQFAPRFIGSIWRPGGSRIDRVDLAIQPGNAEAERLNGDEGRERYQRDE